MVIRYLIIYRKQNETYTSVMSMTFTHYRMINYSREAKIMEIKSDIPIININRKRMNGALSVHYECHPTIIVIAGSVLFIQKQWRFRLSKGANNRCKQCETCQPDKIPLSCCRCFRLAEFFLFYSLRNRKIVIHKLMQWGIFAGNLLMFTSHSK